MGRPTKDGLKIILVGDKTSHGGEVISGSGTYSWNGRKVARVGDKVSCPKCKGTFAIAEGSGTHSDNGKAVAFHGHPTTCGATLIAG